MWKSFSRAVPIATLSLLCASCLLAGCAPPAATQPPGQRQDTVIPATASASAAAKITRDDAAATAALAEKEVPPLSPILRTAIKQFMADADQALKKAQQAEAEAAKPPPPADPEALIDAQPAPEQIDDKDLLAQLRAKNLAMARKAAAFAEMCRKRIIQITLAFWQSFAFYAGLACLAGGILGSILLTIFAPSLAKISGYLRRLLVPLGIALLLIAWGIDHWILAVTVGAAGTGLWALLVHAGYIADLVIDIKKLFSGAAAALVSIRPVRK